MQHVTCTICAYIHDTQDHEPRILHCGHTICLKCLKTLTEFDAKKFNCPICRTEQKIKKNRDLDQFLKNFKVLDILETIKPEDLDESDGCIFHKIPNDIICINCQSEICYKCAYSMKHDNHETVQKADFIKDMTWKANDLELWLKKVPQHNSSMEDYLSIKYGNLKQKLARVQNKIIEDMGNELTGMYIKLDKTFQGLQQGRPFQDRKGIDGQLIFDYDKYSDFEKSLKNFKIAPNDIKNLIALNQIDLNYVKNTVQNGNKNQPIKDYLNSIEKTLISDFKKTVSQTIQQEKEELISSFLFQYMKYNKILREIVLDSSIQNRYSKIDSSNLAKLLNHSKKLKLELKSVEIPPRLVFDFLNIFWIKNSIHTVAIIIQNKSPVDQPMLLVRHLPTLFNLKTFQFKALNVENFDNQNVDDLAKALKAMRIRHLDIEMVGARGINGEVLGNALENIERLQSLSLKFENCPDISQWALSMFCISFTNFKNLSELRLSFKGSNLPIEVIEHLQNGLAFCLKLEKLELRFQNLLLNNNEFIKFIQIFKFLKILKSLKLDVSDCQKFDIEALKLLAQVLEDLNSLETIEFVFTGCPLIEPNGIREFGEQLEQVQMTTNLKEFRIDPENKIVDHKILNVLDDEKVLENELENDIKIDINPEEVNENKVDEEEELDDEDEQYSEADEEEKMEGPYIESERHEEESASVDIDKEAAPSRPHLVSKNSLVVQKKQEIICIDEE